MPEYIVDSEQEPALFYGDKYDELIRCKDCKYWMPHSQLGFDEDNEEYHNYCERLVPDDQYYAFRVNENHFCAWAKRKEE